MDDPEESAEVVRRIASGGAGAREAETELCRRFGRRAELYGRRHLRDADLARDLAQTVLLAVLEAARAGRIEDPRHLDRFVLGTCRNVALRIREADRRVEPTDVTVLESLAVATPSLETLDAAALFRCIRTLDARGRTVVYLSFNEGRSADEIAVLVETTPGNVRVLRHRAVAQLRRCLDASAGAVR